MNVDGAALDKFKKICGLLTSEHDGERATAARMASALLKQNGVTWSAVSIGGGPGPGGDARGLQMQIGYWQMMLNDERLRTKNLTKERDALRRQVKTLELKLAEQATGVPVAEQRKREKADKKARKAERLKEQQREAAERAAERAANPRSEMPIDAELRDRIDEALREHVMPERTRDFLASVKDQKAWTFKQREAIRKTLGWVFRSRGDD